MNMALIYVVLATLVALVAYHFRWAFDPQLAKVSGPILARFSRLYRLSMVARGRAPQEYRAVHEKYGCFVRVGPRHVSISDPAAIPIIYGVGSKFNKVSYILT